MAATLTPTQDDIDTVLRSFLLSILPSGIEVILGQVNRVPEPQGTDFVVFTWIDRQRIETNVDSSGDVFFTANIANGTMTVTQLSYGTISVGATVFGTGVVTGTTVTALGSGSGSVGTYTVSPRQNAISEPMAAGSKNATENADIIYQLDVYGPNASNNSKIIETLWRDQYAFDVFQALNPNVAPLYADNPKQLPAIYGEDQFENRWTMEAHIQANQTVGVPQQYASIVTVIPESVDVVFPP